MKCLLLFFLLGGLGINAQEIVLRSPDGKINLRWRHQAGLAMTYVVSKGNERVIDGTTSLQIDGMNILKDATLARQQRSNINEQFSMLIGKSSVHQNHYNELRFNFKGLVADSIILVCRAYNDGVAFRWLVYHKGTMKVEQEATSFQPVGTEMYIQEGNKSYENFYQVRNPDSLGKGYPYLFPFLLKSSTNWCLVSEAGAFGNYPGTQLQIVKDGKITYLQTTLPESPFIQTDSVTTPWRFFVTGTLAQVVQSSLQFCLAPPPQAVDWSWVKPGVATFPWWGDHFSSSKLEVLTSYVDLADSLDWEWIEFDVALVGTDFRTSKLWETTGWIKELTGYAEAKGIKVYGWDEMTALDTKEKRKHIFKRYNDLGIDGIKIDFLDSDALRVMQFRKAALEDAAAHKLMVSFHGETIPRGEQRTFPNLMTHESVLGAEYYTFENTPKPTPEHNTTLPYTRNVIGSMDYTPATFTAKNRKTTAAHELALPFVFESGWKVMADLPPAYLNSPAREALKKVEAAWDQTVLLDGYPGKFAVIARRKGRQWVIAGINAKDRKVVSINANAIGRKEIGGTLFSDSKEGSGISITTVKSANRILKAPVEANGGFVLIVDVE